MSHLSSGSGLTSAKIPNPKTPDPRAIAGIAALGPVLPVGAAGRDATGGRAAAVERTLAAPVRAPCRVRARDPAVAGAVTRRFRRVYGPDPAGGGPTRPRFAIARLAGADPPAPPAATAPALGTTGSLPPARAGPPPPIVARALLRPGPSGRSHCPAGQSSDILVPIERASAYLAGSRPADPDASQPPRQPATTPASYDDRGER